MIIHGDSLTILRTLPDESVNCCVTSPPYWGLRDYGTAKWEGGDPGCDHLSGPLASSKSGLHDGAGCSDNEKVRMGGMPFRDICGKCGAIRIDAQLGLEKTPDEYVARMVEVFREVRRVLKSDGTLWLNLGDSYFSTQNTNRNGCDGSLGGKTRGGGEYKTQVRESDTLKHKDLCGIPWRVAFALQADGWWLRQDIIWAKPNPMPESVRDRCTKSHEYIFMLSKSARYWYDAEAVKEESTGGTKGASASFKRTGSKRGESICPNSPMPTHREDRDDTRYDGPSRNLRSVWAVATRPYAEAHFATFPPEIPERCIKAGCPKGGVVLDPFFGAGTTGLVAARLGREFIGIELNADYCEMARRRIYGELGAQIEK